MFKFFYNQLAAALSGEDPGSHFIAITDAGSQLDQIATDYHFRQTFHNDPNIGGRYSALSHFGLVPAALIGVDLETLLNRAASIDRNNAALLGATMGELAQSGRDKLSLLFSPGIASFGNWVEQLIAESTGKDGRGILPVVGEPVNLASYYGDDRLFVYLKLKGDPDYDDLAADLEQSGYPVIHMQMDDKYDLGEQMFLWELATAVAGARLEINPFDQPNVESAKVLAREMVSTYLEQGQLPRLEAAQDYNGITVFPDRTNKVEGLRISSAGDQSISRRSHTRRIYLPAGLYSANHRSRAWTASVACSTAR